MNRNFYNKIWKVVVILVFASSQSFAQISLLRDINSGASTTGSFPSSMVVLGNYVYYSASDGVTGTELWRSDGTPGGTTQVKDINPGDNSSSPYQLTLVGNYIFFRANDGDNGDELWRTDGTKNGTVMVADINPSNGVGSSINNLTYVNNTTIYFRATNGTDGSELWKYDLNTATASMIKDINPGSANSTPLSFTLVSGTTMYFTADDGTTGRELWKSDGTTIGTVRIADINAGAGGSNPNYLALLGSTVYFAASDAAGDNELWSTNGTSVGTSRVIDLNTTSDSFPSYITTMGSYVYFAADDGTGTYGTEIYRSNGTTTSLVANIETGATSSYPYNFIAIGSTLYFVANTAANGTELYRTTGVGATLINVNINAGASSNPYNLTNVSGLLYFTADDATKGTELFKYNGTSLFLVDILTNAPSSNPYGYTLMPNTSTVFFGADNGSGFELWTTPSGTSTTASQVADLIIGTAGSNPTQFVSDGAGITYFVANDGSTGTELWKTDGTLAGTVRVKDINVGSGNSSPNNLTLVGTTLYFTANDGTDNELWRSDGTSAGTVKLDVNASGSSFPSYLTAISSTTLLFQATDATNGNELWKCVNGASPSLVQNINPSTASSFPYGFKVFNGFVYFTATDGTNGYELWRISASNPAANSASLFASINSGSANSTPSYLTVVGSTLYFAATTATSGNELFKTDGVAAPTIVKEINASTNGSFPFLIGALGSNLLFSANDGTNGNELWTTDGTSANTVMVKNINTLAFQGSLSTSLIYYTVFNNKLYFQAYEPTTGYELWVSDGTTNGTQLFKDNNIGAVSGGFAYPVSSGSNLYFISSDGTGSSIMVTDGVRSCATVIVPYTGPEQTSTAGFLTSIGSKMIFSMVAQGYDREPFLLDPAQVTLPVNTAVNTQPSNQTITLGNQVTFTVAAAGTNLSYQWQKNSVDIPGATSATYNIAAVAAGDAAQYRCVVSGTCGTVNSNQATLTVYAVQPSAQPTGITFTNKTNNALTVSYTAATGSPAGYLILAKQGTASPTDLPVDGTAYTAGTTIGTSTVIYSGPNLTANHVSLTTATNYAYAVFSYNGSGATLNYLTTSPLTGTTSTLATAPSAQPTNLQFSNIASTTLTVTYTAATGSPAGYIVLRKLGSTPTGAPTGGTAYTAGNTIGDGSVAYVGTAVTFNDTGLTGDQTYHYKVFSYTGAGSTINYLTTAPLAGSQLTFANEPANQPTAIQFTNITGTGYTVSYTAASAPAGYLAIRKLNGSPTGTPTDGTVYTLGTSIGDATVAYVGSALTFNETLAPAAYSYDVFAYNGSGASINYLSTSPLEGTLTSDNTPPVITNETSTTITNPATSKLKLVVAVTENESSLPAGSVKAQYRSISGGAAFSSLADMSLVSGKWELEVPASENGELGVDYKIIATNSQGLSSNITSKSVISYSDLSIPFTSFGTDQSNYRIIGIPLDLNSKSLNDLLSDDLGTYDKINWRAYQYDNGQNKNVEMSGATSIDPGKGYWLIIKESKTLDTGLGKTVSVSESQPFKMNITAGWNLIGNPYPFNVLWSDVQTASNVTYKLRTYDGTYNADDTKLDKFEGAFVFATANGELTFPVKKNPNAGRVSGSVITQNRNSLDQPNWEVMFSVKHGNLINEFGGFGMHENAKLNQDQFDDFTLPRFMDFVEVNHTKKFANVAFTKDIVPTANNNTWEFSVDTNLEGNTELKWDNSYFGNSDISLVLWDEAQQRAIDMKKNNSYSFNSRSGLFKVFYGNDSFIKENTSVNKLLIHSVAPNPTQGLTAIQFTVPGREQVYVQVRVINVMGQAVATVFNGLLDAGYQEVIWDGKDATGVKPAQGVYLVEIGSGINKEVKRLVIN